LIAPIRPIEHITEMSFSPLGRLSREQAPRGEV
jgi:hypothetical protein